MYQNFILKAKNILLYVYITFVYSFIFDGHLACLHLLAIMNNDVSMSLLDIEILCLSVIFS